MRHRTGSGHYVVHPRRNAETCVCVQGQDSVGRIDCGGAAKLAYKDYNPQPCAQSPVSELER